VVVPVKGQEIDEEPFIGEMFQRIARPHQIPESMSDLSTVTE
jgi:hypothetical protein